MATVPEYPPQMLDLLREEAEEALSHISFESELGNARPRIGFARLLKKREMTLRKAIPIWYLPGSVGDLGQAFADRVKPLGRWHHQIELGGEPVASMTTDPETWKQGQSLVTSIDFRDDVVAIRQAILEIDGGDLDDSAEVLLLRIPYYSMIALLIRQSGRSDQVLVVTAPAEILKSFDKRLLEGNELLVALSKHRPTGGLDASSVDNSQKVAKNNETSRSVGHSE